MLAGVSAGVIGLDADGRINLPNRPASELLGRDLEAAVGQPLDEVVPEFRAFLAAAAATPGGGTSELRAEDRREPFEQLFPDRPRLPLGQRCGPALLVGLPVNEMAFVVEVVVDVGVYRGELL